ncbi:MAG: ribose-phosphate diphosphokinase [Burkholderiaceae bacterium]|jgi:ribose-phosphate pyrophosphokinase|nr:ribose-phosphate diphosphokinase [Burkholderiaceae bacterium]
MHPRHWHEAARARILAHALAATGEPENVQVNASALLAFDDEWRLASSLGAHLGIEPQQIERHCFPDGELKLRLPERLPHRVVLLRGLHQPNEKLVELLLAAPAARELGARRITLVCPYLAYMRQDVAFQPGEAVSQRHVGALLAHLVDGVVTIDPHLHRIDSLDTVIPGVRCTALSAAEAIGAWVAARRADALLLGPDEESLQWVARAAQATGLDHAVCRKQRLGDRDVRIALPDIDWAGRPVVLMDDVASTGRTLVETARACLAAGARSVDVAVTHALFVGDALAQLRAAGVGEIWSTDAVPHGSSVVSVAQMLADAVRELS